MLASPNDLQYFAEVASTLNFSRASERIGISQPSLSAAMKRLEHAMGVTLFIRGKNGVTLTQAGRHLQAHTRELLKMWEDVRTECLASHETIAGRYKFGCHASVALYALPQFLPALLAANPKLEVQLQHDLSRKILEGIINFSIDLGIVVNPVRHPDLVIHKLCDDDVRFFRSNALDTPVTRLDSGETVIICDPELAQSQWLLKHLHREDRVYRRIVTSSSLEVTASLTSSGAGIGILPECVAKTLCPGHVEPLLELPSFRDEVCLVWRHENRSIRALQAMIASIKACFDAWHPIPLKPALASGTIQA